ncbi:hypothetical protein R1sor_025306 [Riccia sorocarpa]|uniref:CST complex subunit TEN1 n=1 Tax=Riccia sorocarpa TaxID=122646 RepID=A0ABD3G889_9MARC
MGRFRRSIPRSQGVHSTNSQTTTLSSDPARKCDLWPRRSGSDAEQGSNFMRPRRVLGSLPELTVGSQYYKPNQSVRVMGLLESFTVDTGIAVISHGGVRFRVDLEHVRDVSLRKGSRYQFIGELVPDPTYTCDKLKLQARVARNVDGINVDLYEKALQLRRQFERKYLPNNMESSS